jgi:hypothetical protein
MIAFVGSLSRKPGATAAANKILPPEQAGNPGSGRFGGEKTKVV